MGSVADLRNAFESVVTADVTALDADGVADVFGRVRQLESFFASVKVAGGRRLGDLRRSGCAGRLSVVAGQTWGQSEARKLEQRIELLDASPAVEAVLSEGRITPAHVDAVAAAARMTPAVLDHDAELATSAARMAPDEFGQLCKRMAYLLADDGGVSTLQRQRHETTARRWVDPFSGMYHLAAQFDPERGAQVWASWDSAVERHFHKGEEPGLRNDQRAAEALHGLTTSGANSGGGPGSTMHVHIDLQTLVSGLHDRSTIDVSGGGCLPVETVRRLACDGDLIPYVLNGDGVVVDVGRARRLATRRQRHLLRAMYATCAVDGCAVRFEHARIHHIEPFQTGGPTDLANMVPLCDRHHHDVHEGRWTIELAPQSRELTLRRPDGVVHSVTPMRRRGTDSADRGG